MLLLTLNVLFVLIAVAMIALILMQRGAGAAAGSGFGGGASATVFGARGASNFLSKSTKWLAIAFFAITLFMAWQATKSAQPVESVQDLGVMSQVPVAPPAQQTTVPGVPDAMSPAPGAVVPAPASQPAPATPAEDAAEAPAPASPTPQGG
ncbi:preprotein translocase subunit SecG [Luteimonas vadosa]|uniref:Protein-export membrane protein SecG n=1 Tax=Luteimonas vadosa TaxID=1165507 RepID=A0ABP9E104_9GAMM